MISSVSIEAFRGVREGGVEGLAPISILVGPNNSGKSTTLEAIAAVGLPNASEVTRLLLRRGGPAHDALSHLVGKAEDAVLGVNGYGDEAKRIWGRRITAAEGNYLAFARQAAERDGLKEPLVPFGIRDLENGATIANRVCMVDVEGRVSDWATSRSPYPLSLRFVDVEASRDHGGLEDAYSGIELAGRVPMVVGALRKSMLGLTDLRILKSGPSFVLHTIRNGDPPIPAYLAGDGFKRFLALAAAAIGTPKGIVLLEEPESFQHPRYLRELATLLHLAAKEGTQIILSTHSIELIDLLLHAPEAEGLPYPAVHRLRLTDGKLRATTLTREDALVARDELIEDLRA